MVPGFQPFLCMIWLVFIASRAQAFGTFKFQNAVRPASTLPRSLPSTWVTKMKNGWFRDGGSIGGDKTGKRTGINRNAISTGVDILTVDSSGSSLSRGSALRVWSGLVLFNVVVVVPCVVRACAF